MIIALRCERHKHGEYDPDERVFVRKCQQCSRAAGREVYHRWHIDDGVVRGADVERPE